MFLYGLFVLAASCYIIFIISEPLKSVGGKLGKLLRMPEDVVASTFQALATSGPEIVMAILAATPFIASESWKTLEMGEKASSGTLNIIFSAMSNLLGIGAVAIIFMIRKGMIKKDERIIMDRSVRYSLLFYIAASLILGFSVIDNRIVFWESALLMGTGILYIVFQLAASFFKTKRDDKKEAVTKESLGAVRWIREFSFNSLLYAFLVFGLIIFVRESMGASFKMAIGSVFSLGGIIIMFTSYISSFPEFMLAYRYVIDKNKNALLGMLFGSNVIDLGFAGFRALWLNEPMDVYSTGPHKELLPLYIWAIPAIAILAYIGIFHGKIKYKVAFPMVIFYAVYIISGFMLL